VIATMQLAAALLLAAAGIGKVCRPDAATAMLRRAWPRATRRLPVRSAVRAAGLVEVGIAALALAVWDAVSAGLLAGCYLAFLAVAARLQFTGQHDSCGCFGSTESPVGIAHLVVNAAASGFAIAAALRPAGALGGAFDAGGLVGVVRLGQALLLAYLAFLSMTALPALAAARRRLLEIA
jgi:hypothetical protein